MMQAKPMMSMSPIQGLACAPGAAPGGLTRARFFDGMFLTQADLETEQVYWRMKRRLTNRALGTGVVWGLRLTLNKTTRVYRLSPGYAIDCCGNDLVVECPIEVSEPELLARSTDLFVGISAEERARGYCMILQYVECPDQVRPVHRDACSPPGGACEPSRVRETCRLMAAPACNLHTCRDHASTNLCSDLLYPGPVCPDDHHGVYVGCLDQGGLVDHIGTDETGQPPVGAAAPPPEDSFSPWLCRREVLTGPLINWWLCQFGIDGIDLLFNKIAFQDCEGRDDGGTDGTIGTSSRNPLGDLFAALTRTSTSGATTSAVASIAEAQLTSQGIAPLSRAPLRDLVVELAARTPLLAVVAPAKPPTAALAAMTVTGLLAAEPEAVLASVAGADASTKTQRGAVNQLYVSAETFVREATGAITEFGREDLARADLIRDDIKAALAKVHGTTAATIDAAAAAASKR